MLKYRCEFKASFATLGDAAELSQEMFLTLGTMFLCQYGYLRLQTVNNVRRKLFLAEIRER